MLLFLLSACSNCPFHINNSWIKKDQKMYKKEHLKHYLVSKRSHLKSCWSLCPHLVLGCAKSHLVYRCSSMWWLSSIKSLLLPAGDSLALFSPNPALSSSPHGPSTDCNSTRAYIAAQQAKFSSSQPLPLKRQSAEDSKEVSEAVNSGQAVSRA